MKRRTAQQAKFCMKCGKQDDRTKSGMPICAACANKGKASVKDLCKTLYWERRDAGLCVRCGTQDERTRAGMSCCEVCAQYKIKHRKRRSP